MIEHIATKYSDKIVAITGARGYLGAAMVDALVGSARGLIRVSRSELAPVDGTDTLKADISTPECWEEIVSRSDVIFHLAGNKNIYAAANDPDGSLRSTFDPIVHLVRAVRILNRKLRVVVAGTATQYGLTNDFPVNEGARPLPITNYDLHKQLAEDELLHATRMGVLEGTALRISNVYGPSAGDPSESGRGVINKVAQKALQGEAIKVYGDGRYLRDYVYVTDVVRAFLYAGCSSGTVGRPFNVGSGVGVTLRDAFTLVARSIQRRLGISIPVQEAPWPEGSHDIERRSFVADVRALKAASDWAPLVFIKEGIDRMIDHFLLSQNASGRINR